MTKPADVSNKGFSEKDGFAPSPSSTHMKSLKGTQSEKNLLAAFAAESQARNKYTFFAMIAKEQGLPDVEEAFLQTAENEKSHAKLWFRTLGMMKKDTLANLQNALESEHYEWASMYEGFAKQAQAEGFTELAERFQSVAKIEKAHEAKYALLLRRMKTKAAAESAKEAKWECMGCGKIFEGDKPPKKCPLCEDEQVYVKK